MEKVNEGLIVVKRLLRAGRGVLGNSEGIKGTRASNL